MANNEKIHNFTRPNVALDNKLIGHSFNNVTQNFEEPFDEEPIFSLRSCPSSCFNDGTLAMNQKAMQNALSFEEECKLNDYMEQQITQKLRTNDERKRQPTVTQLVQPLKPGQISYGVRTIRTDLKVPGKNDLEEVRCQQDERDLLFQTKIKSHIPIAPPFFHDLSKLGSPRLDLPTVNEMLADELEQTHLAVSAKEFLEGILAKQQLQFLRSIATDRQNQLLSNSADINIEDKPHQFIEPKDGETETCARVRPLIKAAKRVLIAISNLDNFKVLQNPTLTPYDSTVHDGVTYNRDVTIHTSAPQLCPDMTMTNVMHDRAFNPTNPIQCRISALANGIDHKKSTASKNPQTEVLQAAASPWTKPLNIVSKPKVPYQPATVPSSLQQDKIIRTRGASIMPTRGIRQGRISKSKSNKNLPQHDAIRDEALPPSQIKANVATRQWSFTQGLVSTNVNQFAKNGRR
uniref:Protein phosphatase 1 regulatory subunit 35 C-terminal domain-containing protein n=1 Tax=Panagrellus redivivus TaxID=6233 RepID=A0A7E4W7R6_PANRE